MGGFLTHGFQYCCQDNGVYQAVFADSSLPERSSSADSGPPSRSVKLNGKVLKMVDDKTFPDLEGSRLPPAEHLQLPGYSLAFFVFTDAEAAGCV